MSLERNVSLSGALGYKGGTPYWAYILHRIGGIALFIFFTLYILALAGVGSVNVIFSNWLFQLFMLIFGLFHVINGLRITIFDLSPKLMEYYRQGIQIGWMVYAFLCGYAIVVILRNTFGG
jgi:succinate dehydrogenase/fumarate reductase cytochrome b subunit